jgi:hypothetical protein
LASGNLLLACCHKTISLDRLCLARGLPGKAPATFNNCDQTNAEIDQQTQLTKNNLDDVIAYCKADIEHCHAVYKRLMFADYIRSTTLIAELKPEDQSPAQSIATYSK